MDDERKELKGGILLKGLKEIADYLKVSADTVKNKYYKELGCPLIVLPGEQVRYAAKSEDIEEWLESLKKKGGE